MGVIYLRTNKINGMQYVGQTKDFKKRERHWNSTKHKYANQLLTDDRTKYGLENFLIEILEECDDSRLNELERFWIKQLDTIYPNGYNDNEGGSIAFHHSQRTKDKISKANRGTNNGMHGKKPWNNGLHWSKEVKEKLSTSHIGNTSALGHKLSEESKIKISKAKKGKPNTKLAKRVVQIKDNGDVVRWNSVAECNKNGFKTIDRVCRGERQQAYGCKWMYEDDYDKIQELNIVLN